MQCAEASSLSSILIYEETLLCNASYTLCYGKKNKKGNSELYTMNTIKHTDTNSPGRISSK